jgi:hypothetical protein
LFGNQEQILGVSGTASFAMCLIIRADQALLAPLTSLTDLINISNSRAFLIPRCRSHWKLKPLEGFRFPRKDFCGSPSLTIPPPYAHKPVKDAMRRWSGDAKGVIPDRLYASGIRQPFRKG